MINYFNQFRFRKLLKKSKSAYSVFRKAAEDLKSVNVQIEKEKCVEAVRIQAAQKRYNDLNNQALENANVISNINQFILGTSNKSS